MLSNNNYKTLKPHQIWMPLLLSCALVGGILIGTNLSGTTADVVGDSLASEKTGKINELLRYIEARYVEEVDDTELIDRAINSILQELDPHSGYIPADELEKENESLQGAFEGIGVEFMVIRDTIVVLNPIEGGPSASAGLEAGDKIIRIEEEVVAGINIDSDAVIKRLKGHEGTAVRLGILRQGESSLREYTIQRGQIPLKSVEAAYEIRPGITYLKINRFSQHTFQEFMEAMANLYADDQRKDLILDLRNNHGGYLQQATRLLSQFFAEAGVMLVYTEGRQVDKIEYKSQGRKYFNIGDVVVLIDEYTASAGEIVAGALQDQDRGVVVGRRSFGKGLVQEQYDLKDGSAVRLTVSRYYLPSGRSIQKTFADRDAYRNDLRLRRESGELFSKEAMVPLDSTPYYTRKNRVVYAHSGILPDVFVGMKDTEMAFSNRELAGILPGYLYSGQGFEPDLKAKYPDAGSFMRNFRVGADQLEAFFAFAAEEMPDFSTEGLKNNAAEAGMAIKNYLATALFSEAELIRELNESDDFILKALDVLNTDEPLSHLQDFQD